MLPFAVRTGLEPATPGVTGRYSNQLNYRTNFVQSYAFFSNADAKVRIFLIPANFSALFFDFFCKKLEFFSISTQNDQFFDLNRPHINERRIANSPYKKRVYNISAYINNTQNHVICNQAYCPFCILGRTRRRVS